MRQRGPVVVAIAFAGVAIFAMVFFVLPKKAAVSKARQDLVSAQSKEQTLQLQLAQLERAKQEAPQTQAALNQLKEEIPPAADIPTLIRVVADAADATGMNVSTLSPGNPIVDGSGKFAIIPVSIGVDGDFFSTQEFLIKLETLPRAMKVMQVQMTTGTPPYELGISLDVEVYTTDTSIGTPAA